MKAELVFIMAVTLLILIMPEAVYAAANYTVTFDSNGGNSVNSQTVLEGGKAAKPEDPTYGDFKFLGWFENPTVENLYNLETYDYNTFNFDTAITKDTTLTAVWAARLSVNTEGQGQISIAEAGKTPEFNDEYPAQTAIEPAYIGLYDSFVIGAKADEGYKFVKWKNAERQQIRGLP